MWDVPLVWNPEGLPLRVTLGLTGFSDVFINRDRCSCLTYLLPGRPVPQRLSFTTVGSFVGH